MMQIVKHMADPKRAMIRSKEGKMIARTTKRMVVPIRIVNLIIPRRIPDMPTRGDEGETARASRPEKISIVLTMGRALAGC